MKNFMDWVSEPGTIRFEALVLAAVVALFSGLLLVFVPDAKVSYEAHQKRIQACQVAAEAHVHELCQGASSVAEKVACEQLKTQAWKRCEDTAGMER